jgi:hypothetical protein
MYLSFVNVFCILCLKDCSKLQLNFQSHFERLHDSGSLKSERFFWGMYFIQAEEAQRNKVRRHSYLTCIKYTPISHVLGTEQSLEPHQRR